VQLQHNKVTKHRVLTECRFWCSDQFIFNDTGDNLPSFYQAAALLFANKEQIGTMCYLLQVANQKSHNKKQFIINLNPNQSSVRRLHDSSLEELAQKVRIDFSCHAQCPTEMCRLNPENWGLIVA
jgi:hypothetical protein